MVGFKRKTPIVLDEVVEPVEIKPEELPPIKPLTLEEKFAALEKKMEKLEIEVIRLQYQVSSNSHEARYK
jgi:hypothetical protein